MKDENETVRVWLVERGYNNRDLIILKYATPDGERLFRRELSAQAIDVDTVTAAKDVSPRRRSSPSGPFNECSTALLRSEKRRFVRPVQAIARQLSAHRGRISAQA